VAGAKQASRWADFRRRAEYAPESVYRHRTRGWEYIPVHPFGDEPEVLARLGLRPEDCRSADAWWGIDGDATLLQAQVGRSARLLAHATPHEEGWVYLRVVTVAPFVTRAAIEDAMVRFAEAGFPRAQRFRLRWGDDPVPLPNGGEAESGAAADRPRD
jgi:hypothetical protein